MMRGCGSWRAVLGAGVVMLCTTLFAHDVVAQPAPGQPKQPPVKPELIEKAKEHMAAGSAFYNDPSGHKCEEAVREFAKAFEYSGSWRALRAQAICELELERDGEAITHYEQVLKVGGAQIEASDKAQIENDLRALKSAVATFVVRSNKPNAKIVATRQPSSGQSVTNRYVVPEAGVTLSLHPGQYLFTASAEGFPDLTWRAEIANGSRSEKALEFKPGPVTTGVAPLPPPPPKTVEMERPVPVTVWIFTGLTVASAATSATFMGLAKGSKDDFDAQNGNASQAELEDLRSDVITKNIVADVFLGVTAASLGATLIFYFTRPEVPVSKEAAFTLVPQAGPDRVGATLLGSF